MGERARGAMENGGRRKGRMGMGGGWRKDDGQEGGRGIFGIIFPFLPFFPFPPFFPFLLFHSLLKDFTGSSSAARMAW